MALSISVRWWPWTLTQSEETASRYLRPSVSKSQEPQRLEPGLHLREGMPEVRAVEGGEALVSRLGGFQLGDVAHVGRF